MGLTFFMTSHRLRFSQVEGRVGPQPQGTNRIRTPRRGARTSSEPAEEDLPEFGLLRLSDPREDRLKDVLLLGALVLVARRHRVIVESRSRVVFSTRMAWPSPTTSSLNLTTS